MTRLGPDVDAAQKRNGPWTVARKAGYARQMLALVRSLHEKCKMVFVDVKPGKSVDRLGLVLSFIVYIGLRHTQHKQWSSTIESYLLIYQVTDDTQ